MVKCLEWSDFLFSFSLLSILHVSSFCSCHPQVNSLLPICLCDCEANFYSIFDISVAALVHRRPRWINPTFGPVVLFTFDRIYHCCRAGYPDAAHLTVISSMLTCVRYKPESKFRGTKSNSLSIDTSKYQTAGPSIYPASETFDEIWLSRVWFES